jgi:pyruvate formate lyase activating enzyme
MSVNEIVEDFLRYKKFYDNGGVTISGGEPLMQSRFVEELLESFRALKVHTVIDTAGSVPITESKKCLELASLVLLDIKAPNEEMYRRITSQSMKDTLDTLDYCEKIGKSVWIRHVVVPGLTDSDESINGICDIVAGRKCVERVELLPFHKLGEFKWRELGLDYKLYDTPAPTNLRMAELRAIIDKRCKRL